MVQLSGRAVTRCLALSILPVFPLFSAQLAIDHVTIAGQDLDTIRQAFTRATRIPTEYGGRHSNHATEMALTSFPDGSYLEFMAIQPHPDPAKLDTHPWVKFLKSNAGPCAFAIRFTPSEIDHLKAAGITTDGPERGGRTRPDGTRLEWETTSVGSGTRGTFFPFLIRDLTPRPNRAYPSGKPTTDRITGISMVVIGVKNLDDAIIQYRRAFGLSAPHRLRDNEFDAELAWFDGTPIMLAQGLSGSSWLNQRVNAYGDIPSAVVLKAMTGLSGTPGSNWFGHVVFWPNEGALGWRLGMEAAGH
jgi:hypothetical protein